MSRRARRRLAQVLATVADRLDDGQETPPWPRTEAEARAEIARLRDRMLAAGRTMAVNRAIARVMADVMPAVPPDRDWAQAVAYLERLRGDLRAFAVQWAFHQAELSLPDLPELTAAEELELRILLPAQGQGLVAPADLYRHFGATPPSAEAARRR